uniref:Uncharacterized protein n=1 Tax=Arundo donax TaxID=35708 RepID=A0A0A9CY89_ARUDO
MQRFCKRKVFISGMAMLRESILTVLAWHTGRKVISVQFMDFNGDTLVLNIPT